MSLEPGSERSFTPSITSPGEISAAPPCSDPEIQGGGWVWCRYLHLTSSQVQEPVCPLACQEVRKPTPPSSGIQKPWVPALSTEEPGCLPGARRGLWFPCLSRTWLPRLGVSERPHLFVTVWLKSSRREEVYLPHTPMAPAPAPDSGPASVWLSPLPSSCCMPSAEQGVPDGLQHHHLVCCPCQRGPQPLSPCGFERDCGPPLCPQPLNVNLSLHAPTDRELTTAQS